MSQLLQLIIVDDEAFMRENLKNLFPWEELGYAVSAVFSNGQEALSFLESTPADVVLTDIQMPVMDGIQLIKNIRERRIQTEVVFLSAYSDFEYAQKGILYGAVDYLVKPIRYQELMSLFTRLKASFPQTDRACIANQTAALSEPEMVLRILSDSIRKNPSSVTLESCAVFTRLDGYFISRFLKEHLSITFQEFVNKEKMVWAAGLLQDIHLSINEI
ncbi:response regulator, partial [Lacrimispora sp.]|uniref:response regulator n=1 Tax=Lacrimispora sp. TaxID=2719234 RepID=UPI0028A7AB80